jgi:hypothetical protein
MIHKLIIAIFVLIVGLVSCDQPKAKKTQARQKPTSFKETLFTTVTPTADGGAYALGFDSGLWYLRGSEAVKVHFPDLPAAIADTFSFTLQITPLLDGSAYAYSQIESSFWHLREDIAVRVTEASALSKRPISGAVNAFPLYVAERQMRLKAEQEMEERPSVDDEQPEPEEEY